MVWNANRIVAEVSQSFQLGGIAIGGPYPPGARSSKAG